MAEFGEQLRKAREANGMTQQTLAEQLYVTRQTVSRWECGNRFPDLITAKKLSQILGVSVDVLLSEDDVKKVVERNPIIDGKIISKLVMVLYTAISCTLLITFIDVLIRFPLQMSPINFNDIPIFVFHSLGAFIQLCIFVYGFFISVKRGLSPKGSGMIAILYFLSVSLVDSSHLTGNAKGSIPFTLFLITVSMIGAIASYFFFGRKEYSKYCGIIIVLVSVWGILRTIFSTFIIIRYSGQFMSLKTTLDIVLELCIYLLFIYQVYLLDKKRKMVN